MKDVFSLFSSSSFPLQIVVDFDEIKEVLSLLMQPEKTPLWNLRWYVDVVVGMLWKINGVFISVYTNFSLTLYD